VSYSSGFLNMFKHTVSTKMDMLMRQYLRSDSINMFVLDEAKRCSHEGSRA
ncbi:hypothetical protein MKW92_047877, partial [Papaver armeniacum]